ncbi:hypothetical protein BLNAU_7741 [Blattamonas nauphoetae]|uniref:Uncharacterized protein n=1 Tax=Blattamonas nauphoetae TaxID=2049346 RepID=A0ABQ9Y0U0_9EUKA|nr:hypothetical protein BLNAU_7741 [Blattamonas nauphoetae]
MNRSVVTEASDAPGPATPAPAATGSTMRVAHVNKPPRDVPITPTTYTYEVLLYEAQVQVPQQVDLQCGEEEVKGEIGVVYSDLIYSRDLSKRKDAPSIKLGEVEVPSIHHFPHFLRLFVDRLDQVRNPLEGKKWHFVDDLILTPDSLNDSEHYVLLTSPNQKRWKEVVNAEKQPLYPLVLYVSPRYTLAEEINMLNAIPCKFGEFDQDLPDELKVIIKTLGFTPRNVLDYVRKGKKLKNLIQLAENVEVSGDVFGQSISHKLIVLDSPQADPHNFTMAYASPEAAKILAEKWTEKLKGQYQYFMEGVDKKDLLTKLRSHMLPMLFQRLTHHAIRVGAQFSRMKIGRRPVAREDRTPFSFPPTPMRSAVDSSGTCNTHHAFLPDMSLFKCSRKNLLDEGKWGRYFKHHMKGEPFARGPVELKDGKFVFISNEQRILTDKETAAQRQPEQSTRSATQATSSDASPDTSHYTFHYYTFHLVPLGTYNAGFDSILLFFRMVPIYRKPPMVHSLAVHFLQSTIGEEHDISEVGVNLMMSWLVLLMDVYQLTPNLIFPHFQFVVSESMFDDFTPNVGNAITTFIPEENIVTVALTTPTKDTIGTVTIETEDTLILDTGKRLLPNNDEMCVRCGFCGEVMRDNFFDHMCAEVYHGSTSLEFHKQLLDPTKAHKLFVNEPEMSKKMGKSTSDIVVTTDPTFFYTRKTLKERGDEGVKSEPSDPPSDSRPVGLQVSYPCPDKTRPNAKKSGNHFTFLLMNVTMVPLVEESSKQDEHARQVPPSAQKEEDGQDGKKTLDEQGEADGQETLDEQGGVELPDKHNEEDAQDGKETLDEQDGVELPDEQNEHDSQVPPSAQVKGTPEPEKKNKSLQETLLTDSFGETEPEKPLSMAVTVSMCRPLPHSCHLYRTPFFPEQPRRADEHSAELQSGSASASREEGVVDMYSLQFSDGKPHVPDVPESSGSEHEPLKEPEHEPLKEPEHEPLKEPEEEQFVQPPSRNRVSVLPTSTMVMADLIEAWARRCWILLDKDDLTYSGKPFDFKPHERLQDEEPSPFLIDSDKFLGQMMLPFKQVDELRERIRWSFPDVHPSLRTEPLPGTEPTVSQTAMKCCLIVIQQELELLWQMLFLSDMSEEQFVKYFGFSLTTLNIVLGKMELFLKWIFDSQPTLRSFVTLLMCKRTAVHGRLSSFGVCNVESDDKDNLNMDLLLVWKWKHSLSMIEAEQPDSQISKMEAELKKLDEEVNRPVYDMHAALNGITDKEDREKIIDAAPIRVHRDTLVTKRPLLLNRAWTLFDFFGSLAMNLPATTLTRPILCAPYQPMNENANKTREERDVLNAMQYVSSIIGVVEYSYFRSLLNENPVDIDKLEAERAKCLETFCELREYLTHNFTFAFDHLRDIGQEIKDRRNALDQNRKQQSTSQNHSGIKVGSKEDLARKRKLPGPEIPKN